MVRVCQELFLVRDDLRERVRVQCSVLVLIRKTGDGVGKQRDHMLETKLSGGGTRPSWRSSTATLDVRQR